MSKRKKKSNTGGAARPTPVIAPAAQSTPPNGRTRSWIAAGALIVAVIMVAGYFVLTTRAPLPLSSAGKPAAVQPHADYVGAATCKECHVKEYDAWSTSHHKLAMQEADESTVLGNFNNAKLKHFNVESTMFRRDGKFMVRTDGADGKLADFEINYVFGVWPLQQYLVAFPGGRYQTLAVVWDARTKEEGGQRWFHIYPNDRMEHTDQLHWTGVYQNWNLECAACHSTNLKKGYDAATNTYKTTFSEINVACEACHGPASRHNEWAKTAKTPYSKDADKALVVLKTGWKDAWKFPKTDDKYAKRDKPADPAAMNTCAACHARRATITESATAGAPLEDSHRLAMLTPPNYYPDGQQREEVYVWNSFLQTEMHQKGVTCMDCHEPHALKLRAEGNALCTRCHNTSVFDTEKHHFHKAGTQSAQCVECHMPAQNYMVIDARRDHAIRVPRPDLSMQLGSPNACTQCHKDRKPEWAATAMDKWYGRDWREEHYGTTLHSASTQGARSLPSLLVLADDTKQPVIVRATAATLAQPYMRADALPAVRRLLASSESLIRIAALGQLEAFDAAERTQAAAPLLADPVRGVRVEAARVLADVPEAQIPAERRAALMAALKEYVDSLQQDADWPTANVNLGNLYMRQGRANEAIAAFQRALQLDPRFTGAYVNLADAYRASKRDAEGEKILRRGLTLLQRAGDLHHALGLLLVRKGDKSAALPELALAAKLAPDNARYAYVYAVALNSSGKRSEALTALRAADTRHPYDLQIMSALIALNRDAGDSKSALIYAKKTAEVLPNDSAVKKLVNELEAKQ